MSFEQFWTILAKHWKLILICFLIVSLGAYVGSKLMKPVYQSSALVQIAIRSSSNQADYTNLLASDQLVQTEASLAASNSVLSEVASHYQNLTVQQLTGEVTSTAKLNTQLFEIDVLDPSPARAASLANDITATFIQQQSQVVQQDNSQSRQQVQQDLDQTRQQINKITDQISALQAKGGDRAQTAVLQAQLNGLQQHYSQWQALLAQLELTQAQNNDFLRIAQAAQPALKPDRPNVLLNTAGGILAGLLLGILLALLYDRLDTRVRTPEALTELLGSPVLATIWRASSSNKEDVINPTGHDPNAEPYRILRTNIGFSAIDKPLHSLLVTSAMPRDGKSAVAANLAVFMAKAGKSTLLIDADLRRPTQHILFDLPPELMGLSNAIMALGTQSSTQAPYYHQFFSSTSNNHHSNMPPTNSMSLSPFVHSVGIPNLWVMPSGPMPPNPSELLDSKAMQRFLTVIENCGVEVVIFDSPPILGLSDASILVPKVDGVLVVIDISRANTGRLKQLKAVLLQTGANVLGCVINKQRKSRHDAAYGYYYYGVDNQDGEHKSASNGHNPAIATTPSSSRSLSQFDRGTH